MSRLNPSPDQRIGGAGLLTSLIKHLRKINRVFPKYSASHKTIDQQYLNMQTIRTQALEYLIKIISITNTYIYIAIEARSCLWIMEHN